MEIAQALQEITLEISMKEKLRLESYTPEELCEMYTPDELRRKLGLRKLFQMLPKDMRPLMVFPMPSYRVTYTKEGIVYEEVERMELLAELEKGELEADIDRVVERL